MTSNNLTSSQTYPLDTYKTRMQNQLLRPSVAKPQIENLSQMAKDGSTPFAKAAATAAKSARASSWKGIEMMVLRSALGNAIQMLLFETFKNQIMALEFSNGSRDLPGEKRERGRDRKVL